MGSPPPTLDDDRLTDPLTAPPPQSARGALAAGAILLLGGMAMLFIAASLDARARASAPWPNALFAPEGEPPWPGAVEAWIRRVPLNNIPWQHALHQRLKSALPPEWFDSLPLDTTEWFLAIDLPPDAFAPLLDSGRLPRKGTDEVLAGAFARADFVQVDDGAFRVVGRLKRSAGGLATAYVLPDDEVWEPLWFSTASPGWFDPNGLERLLAMEDPIPFIERNDVQGGEAPAPLPAVFACIAGLVVMAAGGGFLHQGLFRSLHRRAPGVLRPALRAATEHPRLVFALHILLYGVFFACALLAVSQPFTNVLMREYVRHAFTEGDLGYVGDAYSSGNILRAAIATWVNNFVVQTAGLTLLLSMAVPLLGLVKTAASFAVVGVGMSPLWSGMSSLFIPHSITMVLELEAYIYACVAVCVFWGHIVKGAREGRLADAAHESFMMMLSATILAGVMLAAAALYEAASLVLLA